MLLRYINDPDIPEEAVASHEESIFGFLMGRRRHCGNRGPQRIGSSLGKCLESLGEVVLERQTETKVKDATDRRPSVKHEDRNTPYFENEETHHARRLVQVKAGPGEVET